MSQVQRHAETAINSDGRRRCYKVVQTQLENRDSSVGVVTKLRVWIPTNRGSISGRGKRPARLWSPPSLVFKRNRGLLPRGWSGHCVKLTIHLQLVKTLRMSGVIPPHTKISSGTIWNVAMKINYERPSTVCCWSWFTSKLIDASECMSVNNLQTDYLSFTLQLPPTSKQTWTDMTAVFVEQNTK